MSLQEEINSWLDSLEYWEKYLAKEIMEHGVLTDKCKQEVYEFYKEEKKIKECMNAKKDIEFDKAKDANEFGDLRWEKLHCIEGINALVDNQEINIGKQLTLIYGENGSGKTGYVRLLNNAFLSKGDDSLVPDINSENPKEPKAEFEFSNQKESICLKYPDDSTSPVFNKVRVFDTVSALSDLQDEDKVDFAPTELKLFDKISDAIIELNAEIEKEIQENKIENSFTQFFDNDNNVKNVVMNLNESAQANWYVPFDEYVISHKEQYEQDISKLKQIDALDIEKQKNKLERIFELLEETGRRIEDVKKIYSEEKIESIKAQLSSFEENVQRANETDIEQFKNEDIKNIGSQEWKEFIESAKKYYDAIEGEIDKCIFCGQDIKNVTVIDKYWRFLKSSAETTKKRIEKDLETEKNIYQNTSLKFFNKDSIVWEWLESNKENLNRLVAFEENLSAAQKIIVTAIDNKKWNRDIKCTDIECANIDFNVKELLELIKDEIEKLEVDRIIEEKEQLTQNINYYTDCKKVLTLVEGIGKYIDKCKYVHRLEECKISTRNLTKKQGELFKKYVNEEYINTLENECQRLNASFGVEIKSRNKNGNTFKKLQLKESKPLEILSEGEQRALALADFFAEATISQGNIAMVFDDPVSSLDHKRKKVIAKRLVEESKERQIIIFTHDISFFLELKNIADKSEIELTKATIRRVDNCPGVISSIIPWPAMKVKDRIKHLRDKLLELRAIEKAEPDQYYYECKDWCELLRESWERAIEEILLNGAIERFNPAIQTQRLRKAKFCNDLYTELENGMAECSSWCHDQASALNGTIPSTSQLDEYIDSFSKYVKENKAN